MLDIPDVKYARPGGVAVAYQVVGEGPRDLVFVLTLANLVSLWLQPQHRRFFEQLASERRLTVINPRGIGLSDRPRRFTLEDWMDDIRGVLDAEGIDRAAVFGSVLSANACVLLAATYPERVERLVLMSPFARVVRSADYEFGVSEEEALAGVQSVRDHWGERDFMQAWARRTTPDWADDEEYLDWFVWSQRLTASPATAAAWRLMQMETDISDILGAVRVPTLVLHRAEGAGAPIVSAAAAGYVAERIPGASCVELPGGNLTPADDAVVEAIAGFLRGDAAQSISDAVLATVLFTDLVGSTALSAELGDRAWRDVLDRHHAAVRREVARFRGEVVDTAGDGFFCRFDGPARALACAREIVGAAPDLGLAVRAGVHTGECELSGDKLIGLSVVIGSRIAAIAEAGEVLTSQTVKDLVAGSGLEFEERGERELKGVPGSWRLYAVR